MSQADLLDMPPVFQLKGSMLAITVLELQQNDLAALDVQLAQKVRQAPQFFRNTPLILALDRLPAAQQDIDLPALLRLCRNHGLRPLALRSGSPLHQRLALPLDMPVLPPSTSTGKSKRPEPLPTIKDSAAPPPAADILPKVETAQAYRPTRVIHHPIRGGQQIYAQGGDLIVLAPVSPGAELLADGNIHVYGALRGRALAGIRGDRDARIFCQELSAEMLSIAGQYKVAELLRRDPAWGAAVQVSLSGETLNISRL